jgi:hypothetical protein
MADSGRHYGMGTTIDLLGLLRSRGQLGMLATLVNKDPLIRQFLQDYRQLVQG